MGNKASNYLPLFFICLNLAQNARALTAVDSELNDAVQKKDWPAVVFLLEPKKGQNFERDLLLAKALLILERRLEALKLLTTLAEESHAADPHRDERVNRLLQSAGTLFFAQETSNLYYESLELIRMQKFADAKERIEQGLTKEPYQLLLLTRLIQVELVLGQKELASANLKIAQSISAGQIELKLFAAKLSTDAQILAQAQALTVAQAGMPEAEPGATPAPVEIPRDLELVQELTPIRTELLQNEVTLIFWFEALKEAQKFSELESLIQKLFKEHPLWTGAWVWCFPFTKSNSDLQAKLRTQIEKNLKNKDAFEQALAMEMKRSEYLWMGYVNFDALTAVWTSLQSKATGFSPFANKSAAPLPTPIVKKWEIATNRGGPKQGASAKQKPVPK